MTAILFVTLTILAQAQPADDVIEPLEVPQSVQVAAPPVAPVEKPAAKFARGTVLYVNATSLALRSGPRRDTTLIHYMPQNTKVTVLDPGEGPVADKIGDKPGQWIQVQHESHTGYAFDAFLIAAPPTLETSLDFTCIPGKSVGPISAKTTYADIVAIFGSANVGDATIPLGEGKSEAGTVIFADSPDKRLFIQWATPKQKPHSIIIEGTRWKTAAGIGIGTPLSEIVKANEGPFTFAGFGWDYAGYVISWKNGRLESDHALGEGVSLFLAPAPPYLPADFDSVQGDKEFSSDLPQAGKLNLRVKAITIQLRD